MRVCVCLNVVLLGVSLQIYIQTTCSVCPSICIIKYLFFVMVNIYVFVCVALVWLSNNKWNKIVNETMKYIKKLLLWSCLLFWICCVYYKKWVNYIIAVQPEIAFVSFSICSIDLLLFVVALLIAFMWIGRLKWFLFNQVHSFSSPPPLPTLLTVSNAHVGFVPFSSFLSQ